MAKPAYELVYCDHCQAVADAGVGRCWLCGHALAGGTPYVPPRTGVAQKSARQAIGLSSLAGPIAIGVVLLGFFLLAPGLGIVALILALPAMIRGGAGSMLRTLAATVGIVILCFVGFVVAVLRCASR